MFGTLFADQNPAFQLKEQRMKIAKSLIIIFIGFTLYSEAGAQFYNGHQMPFGKNKVQHYDYYWSFYRFDDFDCYFNEFGQELAQFTADFALKKLNEIEEYFDYTLEKRLIFIIFNKMAEFRQSNIGLVTFDEDTYNTGGFSRIIKNKVMVYYEGDHVDFQKQIAASIAEAMVNEMLYSADMKDRISSSSVIQTPDWFLKGLVNYVAFGWDFDLDNRLRDGLSTGKYSKINQLEYDDAIYAGQSFWRFIGREYGDAIIPNIIYLTKIYKNIDDGFLYVTGKKLKELIREWRDFYAREFEGDRGRPDNNGNVIRKSRREQMFQQVRVSPDGAYIAYVTNDWGRKRIWIYDRATEKQKVIFRAEPRFEQKTDNSYPVIAWHPSNRILTYINEEKAGLVMYFHRVQEKSTEERNLLYFDKVLDFSYSPDGTRLVFSAVKDGITDIYIHTIASGTNEQITRDLADDLHPRWLREAPEMIMFTSNRLNDTLTNTGSPFERLSPTFDLFLYNTTGKGNVLTRLPEGRFISRYQPSETGRNRFTYVGDNNGILNRFTASFDSTISHIDTITHYRYFIRSQALTDYDRNILDQSVSDLSDIKGEILIKDGKYQLREGQIRESDTRPVKELVPTRFREERNLFLHKADSIDQIRQWLIAEDRRRRDTLTKPLYEYYITDEPIDINHYIFEKEKQNYYDELWRKDYMDIDLDTGTIKLPLIRIYETSFYNNYIANQVDFSFLNNAYQVFNGGAPYFNPGLNMLTKFGILDLFEDYRLTAGFRFSGNFDSNEYLISAENLKGKFDKQLIFHRQAFFSSDGEDYFRTHTHNVHLSFARPFTPVFALKGTLTYRYDRHVYLATDVISLTNDNISRHWLSLKGEAIYDNTRKRAVNIYFGTRFKVFGEYYRQLVNRKSDMIVIGADFRHYTRIHRELIWANRFAASASYGPTKLVYYLGGVDNWMGYLFSRVPMFDSSVPVSPTVNYGFQALATNMRGFSQNVRNGSRFALINSEIRWPFVRYFAGYPLRSNFLNSLQIVGFGDLGTAWEGRSPWSGENAYDTETIINGPVEVTLDTNRKPIVGGFGAGLRAQIFGYFVRADWAWGVENDYIMPRIFYLSFSLDF